LQLLLQSEIVQLQLLHLFVFFDLKYIILVPLYGIFYATLYI